MDAQILLDFVGWLIKAIIPFAVAVCFALWLFFRQKEHESITKRYLEGGVDMVASCMEENLSALRNNWAITLRLLKEYREYGDRFDARKLTKGYLEIHSGKLNTIANQRVCHLTGSYVFWNTYQLALAFCKDKNDELKEITGIIKLSLTEEGKKINRNDVIDKSLKILWEMENETKPYNEIVSILVKVGMFLERQSVNYKKMGELHKDTEFKQIVKEAEMKAEIIMPHYDERLLQKLREEQEKSHGA